MALTLQRGDSRRCHCKDHVGAAVQRALSRAPVLERRPAESDSRCEDCGPPTIPALQVLAGIQRPTLSLPDATEPSNSMPCWALHACRIALQRGNRRSFIRNEEERNKNKG